MIICFQINYTMNLVLLYSFMHVIKAENMNFNESWNLFVWLTTITYGKAKELSGTNVAMVCCLQDMRCCKCNWLCNPMQSKTAICNYNQI